MFFRENISWFILIYFGLTVTTTRSLFTSLSSHFSWNQPVLSTFFLVTETTGGPGRFRPHSNLQSSVYRCNHFTLLFVKLFLETPQQYNKVTIIERVQKWVIVKKCQYVTKIFNKWVRNDRQRYEERERLSETTNPCARITSHSNKIKYINKATQYGTLY